MVKKIEVLSREVRIAGVNGQDYVSLTDIARYKNADASDDLIRNWLRNRNTLEFLGIWEQINVCLSYLENLNALFISERLTKPSD